jgi:hypothetical protein
MGVFKPCEMWGTVWCDDQFPDSLQLFELVRGLQLYTWIPPAGQIKRAVHRRLV